MNTKTKDEEKFYDFIIFTYFGDRFTIFPCVFNILKTFEGRIGKILIADDGFCPMDEKSAKVLVEKDPDHIIYEQTGWRRNGNLIGTEHSIGYLALLKRYQDSGIFKSPVIIKVDPDAAILKSDWVDAFYDSNYGLTGSFKQMDLYPMGNCYAFKSDYVSDVLNDMIEFKPFINCFEDYEIGSRIGRVAKERGVKTWILRYDSGPSGNFILQHPEERVWPEELLKQCRVFCNGFGVNAQNKQLQGNLQDYLWRMRNGEDVSKLESGLPIFRPTNDPSSPNNLPVAKPANNVPVMEEFLQPKVNVKPPENNNEVFTCLYNKGMTLPN